MDKISDNVDAVVVDLGSETIRAGYCCDPMGRPQMEISSIAGVKKSTSDGSNQYFLDDAMKAPIEGMKLNPIIFDGLSESSEFTETLHKIDNFAVQDWDLFEQVMNSIIKRLNCDPTETFFIFSEALVIFSGFKVSQFQENFVAYNGKNATKVGGINV